MWVRASPGKTGVRHAEDGKEGPGEGTQGTIDSEMWETVQFNTRQRTLFGTLQVKPLVLKEPPTWGVLI